MNSDDSKGGDENGCNGWASLPRLSSSTPHVWYCQCQKIRFTLTGFSKGGRGKARKDALGSGVEIVNIGCYLENDTKMVFRVNIAASLIGTISMLVTASLSGIWGILFSLILFQLIRRALIFIFSQKTYPLRYNTPGIVGVYLCAWCTPIACYISLSCQDKQAQFIFGIISLFAFTVLIKQAIQHIPSLISGTIDAKVHTAKS